MAKCSACFKEVSINEFLDYGGLCKECSLEVNVILKQEGQDGIRRFWSRKREEAANRE